MCIYYIYNKDLEQMAALLVIHSFPVFFFTRPAFYYYFLILFIAGLSPPPAALLIIWILLYPVGFSTL